METKDPKTVNFADYNPRKMSSQDGAALDRSLTNFGDISGFTNNTATNTWVTGHARMALLEKKYPGRVTIHVEHITEPDEYGTVGMGYIGIEGTNLRFGYREVSWDIGKEKAANVAANQIHGDFDDDKLAQVDYDLSLLEDGNDLLALTGQSQRQIDKMLESAGVQPNGEEAPDEAGEDPKEDASKRISATKEQWIVIDEAVENIKTTKDMATQDNGSKYGTALYYLARAHLDQLHGEADA